MTKNINRRLIAVICSLLAAVLVALTIWDGAARIESMTTGRMVEQLSDITSYSSNYVRMYFKDMLRISEDLAKFIGQHDDIMDADVMNALGEVSKDSYAFDIAVSDASGRYLTTSGASGIGEPASALLDGTRGSIAALEGDTKSGRVVRISSPIMKNGEVVGALSGVYDSDMVSNTLSVPFWGDTGYFHVFMPDGSYVLRSSLSKRQSVDTSYYAANDSEVGDGQNFDKLIADIKAGRSGVVNYTTPEGERMYGYYTLLGINDWYIICVAPEKLLNDQIDESRYEILLMTIKALLVLALLTAALIAMVRRAMSALRERTARAETRLRRQRAALGTLGAPAFEFDLRALEARPLDDEQQARDWFMERVLIPEHAGEIVDPRDEAAYLKLCDAILTARGMLSADFRMRRTPDGPFHMYRMTLSAPKVSGECASTVATMVDLEDLAQRVGQLKMRAARDELTGLSTLSELKICASRMLERPLHHFGTLAMIAADNQDAACDSAGGMSHNDLIIQCSELVREAMGECDLIAHGGGGQFWVFSGDQTGTEIIQKGMNAIMDSKLGGGDIKLTFSCGIAKADPDDGIDELIERAYAAARSAHLDGGHRLQHG